VTTTQITKPTPCRPRAEALAAIDAEEQRLTRELAALEADLDAASLESFTLSRPRPERARWLRDRRAEILEAQDRVARARRMITKEEEKP